MKKLVIVLLASLAFLSCTNSKQKQQTAEEPAKEVEVMTVDDLYAKVGGLLEKEVVFKGTVTHVCKHGGARCFLMGTNEDITIRVEAGEEIGAFTQEQLGSELEVVGILKEVLVGEATHDEHAHVHGEAEEGHGEDGHEVQTEEAEPVYFVEGLKAVELTPAPEKPEAEEEGKEEAEQGEE